MYDENGKPQIVNFSPSEVNKNLGVSLVSLNPGHDGFQETQRHQEQLEEVTQNANCNLASDLSAKKRRRTQETMHIFWTQSVTADVQKHPTYAFLLQCWILISSKHFSTSANYATLAQPAGRLQQNVMFPSAEGKGFVCGNARQTYTHSVIKTGDGHVCTTVWQIAASLSSECTIVIVGFPLCLTCHGLHNSACNWICQRPTISQNFRREPQWRTKEQRGVRVSMQSFPTARLAGEVARGCSSVYSLAIHRTSLFTLTRIPGQNYGLKRRKRPLTLQWLRLLRLQRLVSNILNQQKTPSVASVKTTSCPLRTHN